MKTKSNLDKTINELMECSILAYEVFHYELTKQGSTAPCQEAQKQTIKWFNTPNEILFKEKPVDCILSGKGEELKKFLKDKLDEE